MILHIGPITISIETSNVLKNNVREAYRSIGKIEAIKLYKNTKKSTLAEAKTTVENWCHDLTTPTQRIMSDIRD